uniref:Uncharacterized protein n=1 Tax=Anabas testudineus TaxID=64144 RepID=A0A7N6FEU7_ANATE
MLWSNVITHTFIYCTALPVKDHWIKHSYAADVFAYIPVYVPLYVYDTGRSSTQGQRRTRSGAEGVGEDRAILLGFTMIAFSVLMFFVVGITVVKPYINSNWEEKTSCVLVHTDIPKDWVDCRGVSTVPCLRVTVNLTDLNQSALLHFNEEPCFYIPKCRMDKTELQDEVQKVKKVLDSQLGNTSSCFTDRTRHPRDVILSRKYTLRRSLFSLLWPCLMLGGGALLVGLVKLTQYREKCFLIQQYNK